MTTPLAHPPAPGPPPAGLRVGARRPALGLGMGAPPPPALAMAHRRLARSVGDARRCAVGSGGRDFVSGGGIV